jgi:hypothetical protein
VRNVTTMTTTMSRSSLMTKVRSPLISPLRRVRRSSVGARYF